MRWRGKNSRGAGEERATSSEVHDVLRIEIITSRSTANHG